MSNAATNLNGNGIRPVPGLDDLARDSRCAAGLPKAALLSLLLRTAAVQSCLTAQLATIDDAEHLVIGHQADRQLKTNEIAEALGVNRRWLFRNLEQLKFISRSSPKKLVASESAVRRWRDSQKA
jgi:hypothetical protein